MSTPHGKDSDSLVTPILLKTRADQTLPADESAYLVLANNGLWFCRNHEFFESSVKARSWPNELAQHASSLQLRHPKVPQAMLERTVGFFDAIAQRDNCEAGVLLAWDRRRRCIRLIVPRQVATFGVGWSGGTYPVGLHYDTPSKLPLNWSIIGDVHSHVYGSAYSSGQDQSDEEYRTGLHLVIGRLDSEPPQFHAEYVVDGERFRIDPGAVMAGYHQRDPTFPQRWMQKVRVKEYSWSTNTH
jgi:hypothetical protein